MNYRTAMTRLINKPFLGSPKYREQQGRAVRKGCHDLILKFEGAFVRDMRSRGIPMFAHSMYRDGDEQDRLYDEGRSNARAGESAHNHGMAVDLIHSTLPWGLAKDPNEAQFMWDVIGHIGQEVAHRLRIPMVWGGNWQTLWDPAHWEIEDWRTRVDVSSPMPLTVSQGN